MPYNNNISHKTREIRNVTRVKTSTWYLRYVSICNVPCIVKLSFGSCVALRVDEEKCKKALPNDDSRGVPKQGGGSPLFSD